MSHDAGQLCYCTTDHRPHPMELNQHHIWPLGTGGADVPGNRVWLCPTTHVNVHEILRALMKDGRLTYYEYGLTTDEQVSHYAFGVALDGFDRWRAGSAASA